MTALLGILAALTLLPGTVGSASAWPLDELNQTVNQTNFIVDGRCSGTLISVKERLVLTNHHCVEQKVRVVEDDETQPDGTVKKIKRERREEVPITQNTYKGHSKAGSAEYVTDIVAQKRKVDLALLQMRSETIPYTVATRLRLPDKPLRRGERVYVVGNPAMLDATVVEGILSNLNRWVEWDDNQRVPYIQFSGGIAGGNSGGALYDNDGLLIGVPGAMRNVGNFLGLAVPVDAIRDFLTESCYGSVWNSAADDAKCRADKAAKAKPKRNGERAD